MVSKLKGNDNFLNGNIVLPLPPRGENLHVEMEIYARFMRHLRLVPNSRIEIKILSAIQFTADLLDMGDDFVAKILVDAGLRAPRKAFPATYLEFADKSFMRKKWDLGSPNENLVSLNNHWGAIGEDKFAAFRYDLKLPSEPLMI